MRSPFVIGGSVAGSILSPFKSRENGSARSSGFESRRVLWPARLGAAGTGRGTSTCGTFLFRDVGFDSGRGCGFDSGRERRGVGSWSVDSWSLIHFLSVSTANRTSLPMRTQGISPDEVIAKRVRSEMANRLAASFTVRRNGSSAGWSTSAFRVIGCQKSGEGAYNFSMKLFFNNDYVNAEHRFDTTRKSGWIADSLAVPGLRITSPPAATREQLVEVHAAEYVDAVITGEPAALARSQGFTWGPRLFSAVAASTGGVIAAARDAEVSLQWRRSSARPGAVTLPASPADCQLLRNHPLGLAQLGLAGTPQASPSGTGPTGRASRTEVRQPS